VEGESSKVRKVLYISERIRRSHTASLDASLAATYSASVVDKAISDYFFNFQEIAVPPRRKTNAAVE